MRALSHPVRPAPVPRDSLTPFCFLHLHAAWSKRCWWGQAFPARHNSCPPTPCVSRSLMFHGCHARTRNTHTHISLPLSLSQHALGDDEKHSDGRAGRWASPGAHDHHRGGLFHQECATVRQGGQGAAVGHCRPAAVPLPHLRVLSWCGRRSGHHQPAGPRAPDGSRGGVFVCVSVGCLLSSQKRAHHHLLVLLRFILHASDAQARAPSAACSSDLLSFLFFGLFA